MVKDSKVRKMSLSLLSILTVVIVLTAAVFSTYAWFTINDKATAGNVDMQLISGSSFRYKEDVYAERHNLDGSIIDNSYKQSNGNLTLSSSTKKENASADPVDNTSSEESNFLFTDMLPGEYVDISISFYSMDNEDTDYYISLENFTKTSTFELQYNDETYKHYVLGAFKVRPVSLSINYTDSSKEDEIVTFSEDDFPYEWMGSYKVDEDDSLPDSKDLLKDSTYNSWSTSYESITFTFRVYEDFSQYFQLVKESGTYVSNLLSQCKFNIGSFVIDKVEE